MYVKKYYFVTTGKKNYLLSLFLHRDIWYFKNKNYNKTNHIKALPCCLFSLNKFYRIGNKSATINHTPFMEKSILLFNSIIYFSESPLEYETKFCSPTKKFREREEIFNDCKDQTKYMKNLGNFYYNFNMIKYWLPTFCHF